MKKFIYLIIFIYISCKPYQYTWNEQLYDIKYLPVSKTEGIYLIEKFKQNCHYPYDLQKELHSMKIYKSGYIKNYEYKYYIIIDKDCRYATYKFLFWERQILKNRHYKKLLNNLPI